MHNENLALISIIVLGLLGWFRKDGLIFLQEMVKIVVGITSKLFYFRKSQDSKVDINML